MSRSTLTSAFQIILLTAGSDYIRFFCFILLLAHQMPAF